MFPGPIAIAEVVGTDEWPATNARGRPFVVYKFGATLDGRVAAPDGTSRWITGPESRAEVQRLRAACHATVVGSGTQQADDPSLAVRDPHLPPDRQPLRVVVDSGARTPAGAAVLDGAAPTAIVVAPDAEAAHLEGRATVIRVPRTDRGLDLHALLGELHRRDVRAVLLEGGPTLAGSFLGAGLVDRVVAYLAPALLGAGPAGLGDAGIATIGDIRRLDVIDVARSGADIRVVARP